MCCSKLNIDGQHPLSVLRAGNMVAELGIVEGKPCSNYVIKLHLTRTTGCTTRTGTREAHNRPYARADDQCDDDYGAEYMPILTLAHIILVVTRCAAALHPRGHARRRQAVIHVEAVAGELREFRHVLPEQVSPNT